MLITIIKEFNSSVLKRSVKVTELNEDDTPKYAIYVPDEERAIQLIDAGVAEEYIPETNNDINIRDESDVNDNDSNTDNDDSGPDGESNDDDKNDSNANIKKYKNKKHNKR